MYQPSHERVTREHIVKSISTQFLSKIQIQQVDSDEAFQLWRLFESAELPKEDKAKKRFAKYEKKIEDCISRALKLHIDTLSCRAYYTFDYETNSTFNPSTMETQPLCGVDPDSIRAEVLYCRYPSLVKHGNDDGDEYDEEKIIKKADVVIAAGTSQATSSQNSIDDQVQIRRSQNSRRDQNGDQHKQKPWYNKILG